MKSLSTLLLITCVFTLHAQDWADVPVPADPGEGKVWELQEQHSDDFNYNGKTADFKSKWNDHYFNGWKGPGLTYWQNNHSAVEDGKLEIRASRKSGTNKVNCGVVTSKTKLMYPVYMEARIKVSNLELSSNFWFLSDDDKREIDVLEIYGGSKQTWFAKRMSTNFHVFFRGDGNAITSDYNDQVHNTLPNGEFWREDYHTFGAYWKSPTEVYFFIDGKPAYGEAGNDHRMTSGSWEDAIMVDKGYTGKTLDKSKYNMDREMWLILDTEDHAWRSNQGIVASDADLANKSKNTMYVDWVRVYKPVIPPTPETREPYSGSPVQMPGIIEAENYDKGGEGIAYHDVDATNKSGKYRTDGVDIEVCGESGYNLSWVANNEWLEYTIKVNEAGAYTFTTRAASESTGGAFHLEIDGSPIGVTQTVPATGDWQIYTDIVLTNIELTEGEHILRFVSESAGYNLDKIIVSQAEVEKEEIILTQGWNLIGSPYKDKTALDAALADIWDKVEVVKDMNDFFMKDQSSSLNSLLEVEFGKGYLIKVSEDCTLEW